jgi:hypothetical protein
MASIIVPDLKLYYAETVALDDVATEIGGAIDEAHKPDFFDFGDASTDAIQAVSDNAGDTTQTLTLTFLDALGAEGTASIALNGTALVTDAAVPARIARCVKSATCAGRVALIGQTAERTDTLPSQSGLSTSQVKLDAAASTAADAYTAMVIRITGGTGANQIRQLVSWPGGTARTGYVNEPWTVQPDGTSTFKLYRGVFFDKTPSEILTVTALWYAAAADPTLAAEFDFFVKLFWKHTDASASGKTLTAAQVIEASDPLARGTFALATSFNDTGTNGVGNNRKVAPSAGVTAFDGAAKPVPDDYEEMVAGDALGVWLRLEAAIGALAGYSTYRPQLQGNTT